MNNIKLVAFDIDGTLIPRGIPTIDDETKKAIKALNDKGIITVVCTGRLVVFIQKDVINTIKSDYFVTINGAVITDDKQNVLMKYAMTKENFEKILEAAIRHDVAISFKYPKEMAVYNQFDHFIEVYTKGNKLPDVIYNYEEARDYHLTHGYPMGAFMVGDNEKLFKIRDEIDSLEFVRAYDGAMECFSLGVSKAQSLKWVIDKLGIKEDEVMAFGDSDNDIQMLKMAKIGIAMGNAEIEVKEAADYVTDTCTNFGIPKALKHFNIL